MLRKRGIVKLPRDRSSESLEAFRARLDEAGTRVQRLLAQRALEKARSPDSGPYYPMDLPPYSDDPQFKERGRPISTAILDSHRNAYPGGQRTPEQRRANTLGKFFALYGPHWDRRGTDTVFILATGDLEVPNPRFDLISIDPESKAYGHVQRGVVATDLGLLRHGGVGAYERPLLGTIDPAEFYADGQLITEAIVPNTARGASLLRDAIAVHATFDPVGQNTQPST